MDSLIDFFIPEAVAQGGGGEPGMIGLLFPVLLIVIFYFLLIRPQQKRQKEHKSMVEALKKGDEVVTSGGIFGKIAEVGDNFILLEAADNLQLKVQKQAVATVMPKGTGKNL
jgi:preprotein translocase subunit YajC